MGFVREAIRRSEYFSSRGRRPRAEHERRRMMEVRMVWKEEDNYMKETQKGKRKPNVYWDTRVIDNKTIWFPVQEATKKFKRDTSYEKK